jgi:hypothetical protein
MAIGNQPSLTGNVASKSISVTATAGQTLFTVTGGYRINQISVFRNGTRLVDSLDYTARDGASVTLLSAATLGDTIEFQVFDDFRVADALDVNSGGTVNGNVNIGSSISLYSSSGIVTATKYYGDGSELTGIGGGVGQPTGDADGLFNYVAAAATVTQSITFDTTNAGNYDSYIVSVIPNITVASGIAVTVGLGKTMVIDILKIGEIE